MPASSTKKRSEASAAPPADDHSDWDSQRRRVIGLGERSFQKSYYPELRRRLEDLGQAHDALQEQISFIRQLIEAIPSPVFFKDAAGRYLGCNQAFEAYIGLPRERIEGATVFDIASPEQASGHLEADRQMLEGDYVQTYEAKVRHADGTQRDVLFNKAVFFTREGKPAGIVGVMQDVTSLKDTQAQLDHLAHHDPLTQAPNRALLHDRLRHAIDCARRDHSRLAVVFVDLDHFKNVNDTLGHDVGDELLCAVTQRLRAVMRQEDTLARLGGDEFVVVLEHIDWPRGAVRVCEQIIDSFSRPMQIGAHRLHITASLGIAVFPDDGEDVSSLLKNADVAMYRAKAEGRNNYSVFSEKMGWQASERLNLESALREAMSNGEFVLHYQPQFDLRSGRLVGAEALIRWQRPGVGLVSPDRFIPIAEESGLIVPIGEWALFEACRQWVAWRAAGLDLPRIAANASALQFAHGRILVAVGTAIERTGIDPAALEIEVTETVLMQYNERMPELTGKLQAFGVELAIDDFGTGYSSLAYLKHLPIQRLKIDRAFIQDMPDDANDRAIVGAIIDMAAALDIAVVAEGVETQQQRDFLLRRGCAIGQGLFWSQPLPADEFERQVRAGFLRAAGYAS